jgi:hypothetical protein
VNELIDTVEKLKAEHPAGRIRIHLPSWVTAADHQKVKKIGLEHIL